jgi:hypothetical protein
LRAQGLAAILLRKIAGVLTSGYHYREQWRFPVFCFSRILFLPRGAVKGRRNIYGIFKTLGNL